MAGYEDGLVEAKKGWGPGEDTKFLSGALTPAATPSSTAGNASQLSLCPGDPFLFLLYVILLGN